MFGHNTTTPRRQDRTLAPWAVGRYSMRRNAHKPRATEFGRGDYELSRAVPPTGRGVCAVEPRLKAWGEARPALGHDTTTPSPHCVVRVLCGRPADAPRGKARAGRAPRDLNRVVTTVRRPAPLACRDVGGVEPRPTAWGGARPALGHNTTTPSPNCVACVLCGRSSDTPRG